MHKKIVLLSHSKLITDGLKEMIDQMNQSEQVEVLSLGGTSTGELGSDPMQLIDAINSSSESDAFLVFADLGSAVMSAEMAKDMIEESQQARYYLVDAPLVEGAFAAAITASVTDDIDKIISEAKISGKKGWS
ncbi:dihydroxyacetone kinase phosphoryl donor subunit DhaM [Vagococcus vulneris]|uniref:phosphoenolpyruvate--glycerone phosphotransferase n=1 Tax=Vagococcus vulneris TaxID=1977869 RepID=A0A429ZZR9_9ENTE|nr:dihydroxyacetone kinase phosphoryl donor subunit DhaM [Vagococcus vulneris]RST99524.1 PTS mannose transporter subunit IIA [Vagococcus vulneris]